MSNMATVYGYNGSILFHGETKRELKHGQGCEYHKGEPGKEILLYRGQFVNGDRDGFGEEYYENGELLYRGNWSMGVKHGQGMLYSRAGQVLYKDCFFNDKPVEKKAKITLEDDKSVEAPLLVNDGYCIVYRKDGSKYYEGEIKQGRFWGRGVLFCQDTGLVDYDGGWTAGTKNGRGRSYYYDTGELEYCGTFSHDKKHGWGYSYHKNGSIKHEGSYMSGLPYGEGISFHENGRMKFEGFFEDHMISRGKEYYENGNLKYEGHYNQGSRRYYGPRYFTEGRLYYETGELWYEGTFDIKRFGSMGFPVFKGAESFLKGKEYDKAGKKIAKYSPEKLVW